MPQAAVPLDTDVERLDAAKRSSLDKDHISEADKLASIFRRGGWRRTLAVLTPNCGYMWPARCDSCPGGICRHLKVSSTYAGGRFEGVGRRCGSVQRAVATGTRVYSNAWTVVIRFAWTGRVFGVIDVISVASSRRTHHSFLHRDGCGRAREHEQGRSCARNASCQCNTRKARVLHGTAIPAIAVWPVKGRAGGVGHRLAC